MAFDIEPCTIEFTQNGQKAFEADLVQIAEGILAITEDNRRKVEQCVPEFQKWLQKELNVVVSQTETLVVMHRVLREYAAWNERLKKNLGDGSNSHGTSEILEPSTSPTIESE